MSVRAYILLDVDGGDPIEVAQMLMSKSGVIMADVVEGPPDIVMVVEARRRSSLAKLTIQALASVENVTGDIQLLPVTANYTHCVVRND